ncbi:ThiF family adenylyltransferase [Thalassospira xiamenensis]|uniref:JAB domain-containing protein n=1 Tax=Thalassospira xiamenensis TaxID=220697 RepID=A0A285TY64_9PROT|nr:ThiF family adenylyltransferase [Thalassospira xiamenensis]SOC31081.1 JAB domain-containing protein [Thalassospira xiamenensis]
MAPDFRTAGQNLAEAQLHEIASASDGAIEIVEIQWPTSEDESLVFRVSLDATGYEISDNGFSFRAREPIRISVPARFPIETPSAHFCHTRFKGLPHVQWGSFICLYQATDVEWNISDGMFGFISRLDHWLRDAAKNRLDPNDAPLHPPVAYTNPRAKRIYVDVNPPLASDDDLFWLGAVTLTERNKVCFDVREWISLADEFPREERLAAVILLSQPMPMEYPDTVCGVMIALQDRGVTVEHLLSLLSRFAALQKIDEPLYMLIGAPMRRRAAGEPLRQHLTVWSIAPENVEELRAIAESSLENLEEAWARVIVWATSAKTVWCPVFDNRPEVTYRRDGDTSASWFMGKSVAVLGCGALGSHISEYVARASASTIRLIDNSLVKPGILARQQFSHASVGYSKQSALSVSLAAINPAVEAEHYYADLKKGWPQEIAFEDLDLIIDATASRRVTSALHLSFLDKEAVPPLLRCVLSARAIHGIATFRYPKSQLGPADILRQTKLIASTGHKLDPFFSAFWPTEQTSPAFQPEPGCSEPTFVGSAADVAFFASSFFNFAAQTLQRQPETAVQALFVSNAYLPDGTNHLFSSIVKYQEPICEKDASHGYRVLLSQEARKSIEGEISSNARSGSPKDETGGLLLGEIDDALQTIYIDIATGAPPDSTKTAELFVCGVEGTEVQCEYHATKSGQTTRFVGVWHTHPVSVPRPSDIDLAAIANILHLQKNPPRHVVMLIIGHTTTRPDWRFHLFRRNEFKNSEETR